MDALRLHRRLKGKLEVRPKIAVTRKTLPLVYTPGVGKVVDYISKRKSAAYELTIKRNSVAIVTDGSRVLGLGNRGPEAALPVMEGKAVLFKAFANIDAFPLCVATQDPHEMVTLVKQIAPVFGGINLEDISTPKCFEIESRLQDIGIPVMHDDQHGTAIVILAALLNACKAVKKDFEDLNIVINGAGAAGSAIARLLRCVGHHETLCRPVRNVLVCDRHGILYRGRKGLSGYKDELACITNRHHRKGNLRDALEDADAFIGLSVGNILTGSMIKRMQKDPIVFALANPIPEIMPGLAKKAGATVVATGRSDFPNQVNNLLAFPGVFRGALDARAPRITDAMKLHAALALAQIIKKPTPQRILPSVFDRTVVRVVAQAVKRGSKA